MPLRDTLSQIYVLRRTQGNTPQPLRNTLSQLYVLRRTQGNTPQPLRDTLTQLYVLRRTQGNTPRPLRNTLTQLYALQRVQGRAVVDPLYVTGTMVSLIRTDFMPDSPTMRVSQASCQCIETTYLRLSAANASLIIRLVDEPQGGNKWRIRPILGPLSVVTVTVPANSAYTEPIKLEPNELLVGVFIPDPWTTSDLGFNVTIDGIQYSDAVTETNTGQVVLVRLKTQAGRYVVFDPMKIPAIRWFRFRCMDQNGDNVNQTTQRTLRVVKVRIA